MYHLGRVIDHVHLRVSNLEAGRTFYRAVCRALHLEAAFRDHADRFAVDEIYVNPGDDYVSRIHFAFQGRSHADVENFYRLAIEAGGRSYGAPGPRPYHK